MRHHPCAQWVRDSAHGYAYAESLLFHLGVEYTYRYGKHHASVTWYSELPAYHHPHDVELAVPLAVKDYPRWENEPVRTYRHFYQHDKASFARWRNTPPPEWWIRRHDV